jgi:hypothetical protein
MFDTVITGDETWSIKPGNKTPEQAVENTEFMSAEKSMHVSLAVQDHACMFLQLQGDSSLGIHCTRSTSETTVLFRSADKVTEEVFEGKDPNSGLYVNI